MSRASDLANVIASGSTDIVAEGTATTNLQQGLAKGLLNYDHVNGTVKDSLNNSSVSDDATAQFTINYTNSFGNLFYYPSSLSAVDHDSGRGSAILGIRASGINPLNDIDISFSTDSTNFDSVSSASSTSNATQNEFSRAVVTVHGDLA